MYSYRVLLIREHRYVNKRCNLKIPYHLTVLLSIPCDKLPWLLLKKPPIHISIDEWIEVWGNTVGKAKIMEDLPMWLQYYPKVLFNIINRSGMYVTLDMYYKINLFSFTNNCQTF